MQLRKFLIAGLSLLPVLLIGPPAMAGGLNIAIGGVGYHHGYPVGPGFALSVGFRHGHHGFHRGHHGFRHHGFHHGFRGGHHRSFRGGHHRGFRGGHHRGFRGGHHRGFHHGPRHSVGPR